MVSLKYKPTTHQFDSAGHNGCLPASWLPVQHEDLVVVARYVRRDGFQDVFATVEDGTALIGHRQVLQNLEGGTIWVPKWYESNTLQICFSALHYSACSNITLVGHGSPSYFFQSVHKQSFMFSFSILKLFINSCAICAVWLLNCTSFTHLIGRVSVIVYWSLQDIRA